MTRFAAPLVLLAALAAACSDDSSSTSSTTDAGRDVAVVADTAGQKNDGVPPADVSADAPSASLADAVGRDPKTGATDLPIDLSCVGAPMPVKTGEATDRTVLTADLGDDSTLVPETDVEIFYSNTLAGTADVTGKTAAMTADMMAKITPGFFAVRTKKMGRIETVAYDWWLEGPKVTFATAHPDKLAGLQVLIGGADFVPAAGTTRLVVRVKDCKQQDVANAHVVVEVDGKIVAPVTKGEGIRRNYFSDSELPSKGTETSRAGIAAFLNVPATSPVRVIAYGKVAGAVVPLAIRPLKPVADGIVTAYITPWVEP
jgi:hypothetical protein